MKCRNRVAVLTIGLIISSAGFGQPYVLKPMRLEVRSARTTVPPNASGTLSVAPGPQL